MILIKSFTGTLRLPLYQFYLAKVNRVLGIYRHKQILSLILLAAILQITFAESWHFLTSSHEGTDCHASGKELHFHQPAHEFHDCLFLSFTFSAKLERHDFDFLQKPIPTGKGKISEEDQNANIIFVRTPPDRGPPASA